MRGAVAAEHDCHAALLGQLRSASLLLVCESRDAHHLVALEQCGEPRSIASFFLPIWCGVLVCGREANGERRAIPARCPDSGA
jgi:hypothetical protein